MFTLFVVDLKPYYTRARKIFTYDETTLLFNVTHVLMHNLLTWYDIIPRNLRV